MVGTDSDDARRSCKSARFVSEVWEHIRTEGSPSEVLRVLKPIAYSEKMRLYSANYYKKHPERVKLANKRSKAKRHDYYLARSREDQRRGREKLRRLVIGAYSNQANNCSCCGESEFDFLTIDHINGKSTDVRGGASPRCGYPLYRWLVRNEFPQGYQVLCMNCNVSKGKRGICAHMRNKPGPNRK